jgi:hypothetical protein
VNYIQWQSRDLLRAAHQSPEFREAWSQFEGLTDDIDAALNLRGKFSDCGK